MTRLGASWVRKWHREEEELPNDHTNLHLERLERYSEHYWMEPCPQVPNPDCPSIASPLHPLCVCTIVGHDTVPYFYAITAYCQHRQTDRQTDRQKFYYCRTWPWWLCGST
jgi:hypothetical protein